MELEKVLKKCRLQMGLSQKEMADEMEIASNKYFYYENGVIPRKQSKRDELVTRIGISPSVFWKRDDEFGFYTYNDIINQINHLNCKDKIQIICYQKTDKGFELTENSFKKEKCLIESLAIFVHDRNAINDFLMQLKLNLESDVEGIVCFIEIIPRYENFKTSIKTIVPEKSQTGAPYLLYNLKRKMNEGYTFQQLANKVNLGYKDFKYYVRKKGLKENLTYYCDALNISTLSVLGLAPIEQKCRSLEYVLNHLDKHVTGSYFTNVVLLNNGSKERTLTLNQILPSLFSKIWIMGYDIFDNNNVTKITLYASYYQFKFCYKSLDDRNIIVSRPKEVQKYISEVITDFNKLREQNVPFFVFLIYLDKFEL